MCFDCIHEKTALLFGGDADKPSMEARTSSQFPKEDPFYPGQALLQVIVAGTELSQAEAITAFRRLYARDPVADARLLQLMKAAPLSEVPRILHTLAAVSDGKRLVHGLMRYLTHPDTRIRAEAALLIARGQRSPARVHYLLDDDDPRVRANVVEGFSAWNRDPELLSRPLRDSNHRVVCNAIVSLFSLDAGRARRLLCDALARKDWKFRAAATWAIGASGCASLYPLADRMQNDPHPSVRFNALRAMSTLRRLSVSGFTDRTAC
jgi:HEAT repeat protein